MRIADLIKTERDNIHFEFVVPPRQRLAKIEKLGINAFSIKSTIVHIIKILKHDSYVLGSFNFNRVQTRNIK